MATTLIKAEGFATMTLAAEDLSTATNGLNLGAAHKVGIEKIGSGNWGYWVLYQIDGS